MLHLYKRAVGSIIKNNGRVSMTPCYCGDTNEDESGWTLISSNQDNVDRAYAEEKTNWHEVTKRYRF